MLKFLNKYTGIFSIVLIPLYYFSGNNPNTIYITLMLVVYARLVIDKFYYTPLQFLANTYGLLLPVAYNFLYSNYTEIPMCIPMLLITLTAFHLIETADRFFSIFRKTKRKF